MLLNIYHIAVGICRVHPKKYAHFCVIELPCDYIMVNLHQYSSILKALGKLIMWIYRKGKNTIDDDIYNQTNNINIKQKINILCTFYG